MKKLVSRILYAMFFGFAAMLVIACTMLVINSSGRSKKEMNNIDAMYLSSLKDDGVSYEPVECSIADVPVDAYKQAVVRYGYDALKDERMEYLYNSIFENVYSITNDPDENGRYRTSRMRIKNCKLTEFDIREVVNAFICDNPEIFWLENLFGYAYDGNDTIIEFYSVLSSDDCEEYIAAFNKRLESILEGLKPDMTDYQRERYLHDRLLSGCVYKAGISTSADGWQYFSSYGALVGGEAVCEGYAKSMQILLTRTGIPCCTVRGDAAGIAHMWNVVQLGGEWYHLDPTWDDNDKDGNINYEYFNLTAEAIGKNHTISESIDEVLQRDDIDPMSRYNFFVPMCTSKEMNYYYAEGIVIRSFDETTDKLLIEGLVQRAKNSEIYLPVRFGTEMTYSEYMSKLFHEAPHEFYLCLESANAQLDEAHRISRESVSVLKNEGNMTLRIRLTYSQN